MGVGMWLEKCKILPFCCTCSLLDILLQLGSRNSLESQLTMVNLGNVVAATGKNLLSLPHDHTLDLQDRGWHLILSCKSNLLPQPLVARGGIGEEELNNRCHLRC